jgi:hypothetical protein
VTVLPFFEAAATAIGAGILIGTFLGATGGVVKQRSRKEVERDSLKHGYLGALGAIVVLLAESGNV